MKEVSVTAYRTRMEIGVARRERDSLIPKLQPLSLSLSLFLPRTTTHS
jgi:hypothetical protein